MAICGRKITTAPTPPMIPSAIRLCSAPAGIAAVTVSPSSANVWSMKSINGAAQE